MKKINLKLVGLDGNAFSIMGAFSRQAREEGWSKAEIDVVLNEARSGDYNHLLCTIMDHCEDPAGSEEEYEYDYDEEEDAGLRTWKGEYANV